MKDLLVGLFIMIIGIGFMVFMMVFPFWFFSIFILIACWAVGRLWRVWGEMTKAGILK